VAHARRKALKTGVFWYMVDNARTWHRCGPGKKGQKLAQAWAGNLNRLTYEGASGLSSGRCLWTFKDLQAADLRRAAEQGQSSIRRRESHWRMLVTFFDTAASIEVVNPSSIRAYVSARTEAGPAAINRDLAVLRRALRLARRLKDESGYHANPFEDWEPLNERAGRREPIALTTAQSRAFLRIARRIDRKLAAAAELVLLTGSRPGEQPAVEGRRLIYPAHKRGLPRTFPLEGRLAQVAAMPRAWSRRAWRLAVKEFGLPLRPHDLRHSAASQEFEAGARTADVQRLLGHRSPQMAERVYTHLFPKPIRRRRGRRGAVGENGPGGKKPQQRPN
jgi:integrase